MSRLKNKDEKFGIKIFSISIVIAVLAGLILPLGFNACSQVSPEIKPAANSAFYFGKMKKLKVEVVYETGAEPYAGANKSGLYYWESLKQNLVLLFQGRDVSIEVPKDISEMRNIPNQYKEVWTPEDALALAVQFRESMTFDSTGSFLVAFVNGYAKDIDGEPNYLVNGFNVTGSDVIIMFKDVIRSTGDGQTAAVPKFVEQSTLVHEMGHALGFVNNGLPMETAHLDVANGNHCTNPNCVMYYLNGGEEDMVPFVQNYISNGSLNMFGPECLQDAQNYRPPTY
jgi:predicted Zn-dependent protease